MILAITVLGGIGIAGAAVLYFVAKKFHVSEDPRIALIEELLPGANCGSCGRSGCHDFACACASASSLDNLVCPGAGEDAMAKIAEITGLAPAVTVRKVAVIHCNGSCENRPVTSRYEGAASCAIVQSLCIGSSDCAYGCLGEGDCTEVCRWNAITINPVTGLPVVNDDLCTGCGACVKACPRHIIELRNYGPKGRRVWVACANKERGALAMKECKAACIGCAKCKKTCPHDAITVTDNLAYIDYAKCKLCRKCEAACPTHAIHDNGFPLTVAEVESLAKSKQNNN